MILSRGAQRALVCAFGAVVVIVWAFAWFAPAIGLARSDAAYLTAARALTEGQGYVTANLPHPIAQTRFPPMFPSLLALWSLVSMSPAWLKSLPVACSLAWFVFAWKVLRKMGASETGAASLVCVAAASPIVIALGTNVSAEPLFALLITAALLYLLEGRPALSGAAAGMATLARTAGIPLIAACMITLVARRRLRDAAVFTAVATLLIAPWFGWALAHGARDPGSGINTWSASNIFTALEPGDKLIVLSRNIPMLFEGPFALLTDQRTSAAAAATGLLFLICLIRRRQLVPDLFVLLYCGMLACWIWPPYESIAPVLPLVLWMLWRVIAPSRRREPLAAAVVLLAAAALWQDFGRIRQTKRSGDFGVAGQSSVRWSDLRRLFGEVRGNTPPDAVLAADLDQLTYLETGRKCIRGFDPLGYDLFYSPRPFVVAPDQLSLALAENKVSYFVLTPDADALVGPALHAAVSALERGQVLEPDPVPGLPQGYVLLKVRQ